MQPLISGGLEFFKNSEFVVTVSYLQIFIVVLTIILMGIFTYLITKTDLGRAQRACEQDRTMTALLGINVDRTISITFIIGSSLASVAGMMFVLYYGVIDFYIGFLAGIKAFTAAVLGGIGSLPGAMLGGLLIGLIETFWAGYVSLEYKDVAAFSVLIVVLIFFPTGFLGKPDIEKV
jgi:branched-chain amino acid transport system permease protein